MLLVVYAIKNLVDYFIKIRIGSKDCRMENEQNVCNVKNIQMAEIELVLVIINLIPLISRIF